MFENFSFSSLSERESTKSFDPIEESPPVVPPLALADETPPIERKELPDEHFEAIFDELLEEVLQSDCEQPSIPEVILAVITDVTSDPDAYYSYVRQAVESDENRGFRPLVAPSRRRTIRTTRRFVGPDGKQEEIVTTKPVLHFGGEQSKSVERFRLHSSPPFRSTIRFSAVENTPNENFDVCTIWKRDIAIRFSPNKNSN